VLERMHTVSLVPSVQYDALAVPCALEGLGLEQSAKRAAPPFSGREEGEEEEEEEPSVCKLTRPIPNAVA